MENYLIKMALSQKLRQFIYQLIKILSLTIDVWINFEDEELISYCLLQMITVANKDEK